MARKSKSDDGSISNAEFEKFLSKQSDSIDDMPDDQGDEDETDEGEEEEEADPEEEEETESDPEEEEEEEESEDEEEEEEEEAEEEDEESEEETEAEIDWSKLPKAAKKAFEAEREKALKWEKNHAKLQSQTHKLSASAKELETNLQAQREAMNTLNQLEAVFEKNPELMKMLESAVTSEASGKKAPDFLEQDPVYKEIQNSVLPMIKGLQQTVETLTKERDDLRTTNQEKENRKALDQTLANARVSIKSMLGREATENDLTQVLAFIVDNKLYGAKDPAKAAVAAVFGDEYQTSVRDREKSKLRAKAKKFGTRTNGVNGARTSSQKQNLDLRGSIKQAFSEQGIDFED